MILANPRYTGRQVWDRPHELRDEASGTMLARESVISVSTAHPPLVTAADFVAAQQIRAARPTRSGEVRQYTLSGMVQCAMCGRRMDSHWVHGRAAYRCRHGRSSAHPPGLGESKIVYVREDRLVCELLDRLSPDHAASRHRDVADMLDMLRNEGSLILHDGTTWNLAQA